MEATLALVGVMVECYLINYFAGRKCRKRIAVLEAKIADLERNQFIELQKQRA
jgi:hypothetical protein